MYLFHENEIEELELGSAWTLAVEKATHDSIRSPQTVLFLVDGKGHI